MNQSELAIVVILRLIGVSGLFAIPAIFLPTAWMAAIHDYLGLGPLPEGPIVGYLARSLSAFYAAISAITLFISTDIRRYRSLVRLWAIIVAVMGCLLLGIDLAEGMPWAWTISEGPPTVAVGLVVLRLQSNRNKHESLDTAQGG